MRSVRSGSRRAGSPRRRAGRLIVPFPIRLRVARLRAIAVRHRLLRRVVGAALILIVAMVLFSERQDARRSLARWGQTVDVVVATEVAAAGDRVGDLEFAVRPMPEAVVPDDALRRVPAGDERVVVPLHPGEVLVARHVASMRTNRLEVPVGTRAIGIPVDATTPVVHVGDLVDVILVADPFDPEGRSFAVRPAAVVVDANEETITLAVANDVVANVVTARSTGRVSLAVR